MTENKVLFSHFLVLFFSSRPFFVTRITSRSTNLDLISVYSLDGEEVLATNVTPRQFPSKISIRLFLDCLDRKSGQLM